MRSLFKPIAIFLVSGTAMFMSSCKDESTSPAPVKGINLTVNASLGSVLTDDKGSTLYFFAKDIKGESNCTGGCASTWPAFFVENPVIGTSLASADLGVITRADGTKQSTYKGFPLYYYSPTANGKLENTGETKGDGVNNLWFAAKASYSIMIANAQLIGHDGKNYTSASIEGIEASTYFVDGNGRTLYTFSNDTKNNNNFTNATLSNNGVWPIFYSVIADLPSILNRTDFAEIDVFGQKQLTFKGRPLYYFGGTTTTAGDIAKGDTRGVSFPTPGVWPIVNNSTSNAPASIRVATNPTFGTIITDSKGRSLYFFTRDANGTNNCTGGCVNRWPIFYTDGITVEGSQLNAADIKEITLADGRKQNTYKGWPLYYFSTNGDGVIESAGTTGGDNFGTVWYIAKDYAVMAANAQLIGNDGKNYTSAFVEGVEVTRYFVDGSGRTLYRFNNDKKDKNNFTNSTLSNNGVWPIFYSSSTDFPSSLSKADFGEIIVFGQKQLTYKGWPLYYFGQDTKRGDNKGISVPSPGVWPTVNTLSAPAPL
jgi:predicted lipoprotein with Yx(FWY)xxD motif